MTPYDDVDRLILEKWDEIAQLIDARYQLEDKIGEVITSSGARIQRAVESLGYRVESEAKEGTIYLWRVSWEDRKKDAKVYFALDGFSPSGYRRILQRYPNLYLSIEAFSSKEGTRLRLAEELRRRIANARDWDGDAEEYSDVPLLRELREVDSKRRIELVSSPETLAKFAVEQFQKAFEIAPAVDECLARF